jgi:hypothetical protein
MVTVDEASARILLGEGAICYDLDGGLVTRDGSVVEMPAPGGVIDRPILVCGSCPGRVRSTAQALERQGLPAWQVRAATPSGATTHEHEGRAECSCPTSPSPCREDI